MMESKRVILIGDIHGCSKEFLQLIERIDYSPHRDRLILLGDLVDRGPFSNEVVTLAMTMGAECVLGNHDERYVRWYVKEKAAKEKGVKNEMKPLYGDKLVTYKSFSPECLEWLATLPVFIRFETAAGVFVAVHGGFMPTPIDQQGQAPVHIRYIDPVTGKQKGLVRRGGELHQPENTVFWTALWKGPENVVYGHHVHSMERAEVTACGEGSTAYGLDTGVCFGGTLTAMMINTDGTITYESVKSGFTAPGSY